MSLDLEQMTIVVAVLSALSLVCIVMIVWLSTRIKKLTSGQNGKSLESVISTLNKENQQFKDFQNQTSVFLKNLRNYISHNITYVETINFKAFQGMDSGGNNSFVTAMLNEHGSGVLISGIHTRDKIHVYSKPVKDWASDRILSDEENDLLTKIKKSRKM